MAYQLTGTVLRVWRAFGRVRFTVKWDGGETATITVPTRQFDTAVRNGDKIGTIIASPTYSADDLIRWNTRGDDMPVKPPVADMTPELSPEDRYYSRIG